MVFAMQYDVIIALLIFVFVSSVTPGPNNLMLMTSGANFGLRRSLPHMAGISIGLVLMIILIGLGLIKIFDLFPIMHNILSVASVVYLLYLAWKIAHTDLSGTKTSKSRPFNFIEAVLFQWVNPKAWQMVITVVTLYMPNRSFASIILLSLLLGVINFPSISVWALMGTQIKRILTNKLRLRAFNVVMASLLIATLYPIVFTSN